MGDSVLSGNVSNTNNEISSSVLNNTISGTNLINVLMKNADIISNQAKGFLADLSKIFKNVQAFKFGYVEIFKLGISGPSISSVFISKSQ